MGELDRFLDEFGGDKEREGGTFTIDYRAARRNLARYQLDSPLACTRNLVMSAVSAGASEIHFKIHSEGVLFEHNGEAPTAEQVPNLFTHLFTVDDSLRHLAVACNYMVDERDGLLVETQGTAWRFFADEVRVEKAAHDGFRVCSGPDFGYRLRGGGWLPQLGRSCRFAPGLVYVDGRLLNEPGGSFEQEVAAVLRLYDSEEGGDHLVVEPDFGMGRCWTEPATEQACKEQATVWIEPERPVLHCRAVLALTTEGHESSLWLVRHGVSLAAPPGPNLPGVVALMGGQGLQLDLSTGAPVQNDAYKQQLAWLGERCDWLEYRLRAAYPSILDRATLLKAARWGY